MKEVFVVETGYIYRGENWSGLLYTFFETEEETEKFLLDCCYKKYDEQKFKIVDYEDVTRLARIITLEKAVSGNE